ncbi:MULTISPECIES: histidine kinase [unclassified Pseudonocardia]|uniref:sensor histidine kinase n=1 Tax=unclassified Pseudonocardia TaxID=2619320 RepID=UPI001CF6EE7E|nr:MULTISPECIES: histidine kinase [unclassified Pseudonocardia]
MSVPARWRGPALTVATEVALFAVAALDSLLEITASDQAWPWVAAGLALLGVPLRRRYPVLGFLATLPGLVTSYALIATLVTLYTLARGTSNRTLVVLAATATAVGAGITFPVRLDLLDRQSLLDLVYGIMSGAAPAALGQLVRAQDSLRRRLRELADSHRVEQDLREEQVLERERNRLAREMHDVVSHQVSLIAVQAGALQVGAVDDTTREAARTIRRLGVSTLDELRHMVAVLRAPSGDGTPLEPQPGLAELAALVAGAGVDAELAQEPGIDLDPHAQRAVYRTVQEGLTNARKHAPGSRVTVRVARAGGRVTTTVHNTRPDRGPLGLPGSRQGLVGLRERAELAGGELSAGPDDDGGFRLALHLPLPRRS